MWCKRALPWFRKIGYFYMSFKKKWDGSLATSHLILNTKKSLIFLDQALLREHYMKMKKL